MACASADTEKDLGWRLKDFASPSEVSLGMVAPRHFNTVKLEGDYVIKMAARKVQT